MKRTTIAAALTIAACLWAAPQARAALLDWNGGVYYWNVDPAGAAVSNWTPDQQPVAGDDASVASGTVRIGSTAFVAELWAKTGGTVEFAGNGGRSVNEGLHLAGGTLSVTANGSSASAINADDNTVSTVSVTGDYAFTYTGTLTGDGDIHKTGSRPWNLATDSTGYTGTLSIKEGSVSLGSSSTFGGTISLDSGGTLTDGSSGKTWTITGGVNLAGGTLQSTGNNGIHYYGTFNVLADTPVNILDSGGFVVFRGALTGSADLNISSANNRGVSFAQDGATSTYSGTITLNAGAYLYFGDDGALPSDTGGPLASLVVLDDGTLGDNNGVVKIGAYRDLFGSVSNVAGVDVTLASLVLGGHSVAPGVYSADGSVPDTASWADYADEYGIADYLVFNNATSTLTIAVPEPATVAFLAIGGLAMAGGSLARARRRR